MRFAAARVSVTAHSGASDRLSKSLVLQLYNIELYCW